MQRLYVAVSQKLGNTTLVLRWRFVSAPSLTMRDLCMRAKVRLRVVVNSCRLACREDDRRTLYGACGGSNPADSSEPKTNAGGDAEFWIQLLLLPDDRIWHGQSHFEERQQASKGLSGSRSGILSF